MKIELKRDSFKYLVEFIRDNCLQKQDPIALDIIYNEQLKPQYDKAYKQYKEIQKFNVGDKVVWKSSTITNVDTDVGRICKITKDSNGRYWYHVKYKSPDYDDDGNIIRYDELIYKFRDKFLKKV